MTIHDLCARLNQSPADLIRLADAHTRAVQGWLSSRAPGAARFDGLGVTATSTGLPIPLLNLALTGGYPLGVSDESIGREIEAVKAFFAGRGVPWYWWLAPKLNPPHLATLLEQHGLSFDRPALPAMIAPLPPTAAPDLPGLCVWQAATRADLEAASHIRRTAFRFPEGAALDYFEAMAADWLAGDPARLYLAAESDNPPAAIGALIMGEGVPGVYVMATLREWRGMGLGKAILSRILAEATAEHHRVIVLTASSMGFPLYQQFGFEQIFEYAIYRMAGEPHPNPAS